MDLKASRASLYSIRRWTGSQWRLARTGVIWSRRRDPVTTRAMEFWTLC